jgi:hypothetical protein
MMRKKRGKREERETEKRGIQMREKEKKGRKGINETEGRYREHDRARVS